VDLPDDLRRRAAANIDAMRAGGDWWDPFLRRMARAPLIPESMIGKSGNALASSLTEPEITVLKCISRGLTLTEAATVLGKSYQTVHDQATSARQRLRAKTTAHAACEAIRLDLIP
jgi:DNA-binding NarL/FixJ family response regulator